MKKYSKPMMYCEEFEPNEYVAVCVVGTVQCTLPGRDPNTHDGTTPWYYEKGRFPHGACANQSNVTINTNSGTGYESNGGYITVSGISETPGEYSGSWTSTDGQATYHHKGTIIVEYQDKSRPNHS